MRSEISFVYVNIWFDVTKCKFIMKNRRLKFLVVAWPIFVADTKLIFVYNFVAPLSFLEFSENGFSSLFRKVDLCDLFGGGSHSNYNLCKRM